MEPYNNAEATINPNAAINKPGILLLFIGTKIKKPRHAGVIILKLIFFVCLKTFEAGEEEIPFDGCVLIAIAPVHGIGVDAPGIFRT